MFKILNLFFKYQAITYDNNTNNKDNERKDPVTTLSVEVLPLIFNALGIKEINNCSYVSKNWKQNQPTKEVKEVLILIRKIQLSHVKCQILCQELERESKRIESVGKKEFFNEKSKNYKTLIDVNSLCQQSDLYKLSTEYKISYRQQLIGFHFQTEFILVNEDLLKKTKDLLRTSNHIMKSQTTWSEIVENRIKHSETESSDFLIFIEKFQEAAKYIHAQGKENQKLLAELQQKVPTGIYDIPSIVRNAASSKETK